MSSEAEARQRVIESRMSQCREPSHYPQPVSPGELDAHLHAAGRVQLVDGAPVVVDGSACSRKWRTIVVDPPWQYRQKFAEPTLWKKNRGVKPKGAAGFYGCEGIDDIRAMQIGEHAEDKAHLYLWVTNHFMVEAHDLLAAWGFEVKTILTWVKHRIGMGFYFRNNTEHVLFGVRGSLKTLRKDVPTAFTGWRGKHSEKPQAFYDMVETMSPGPYLDVFARKQRMGWDVAGNEVYSAIPELAYKPPQPTDAENPRTDA